MINKGTDDESLPPARLVFAYRRLQPHYEFTRRKRVETFKGWSLASTFKSNRSVIKLLRELTFRRDRAIASRNRALFPPTLPFPAVRVSRNKISSCCLHSPLSLSLAHRHTLALSLSYSHWFHGANTSSSGTSATPAKNYGFKEPREIYVVFIPDSRTVFRVFEYRSCGKQISSTL